MCISGQVLYTALYDSIIFLFFQCVCACLETSLTFSASVFFTLFPWKCPHFAHLILFLLSRNVNMFAGKRSLFQHLHSCCGVATGLVTSPLEATVSPQPRPSQGFLRSYRCEQSCLLHTSPTHTQSSSCVLLSVFMCI